jgi:hypothetical protein
MRYLSIIRAVEQQGAPLQGLMDAIDQYVTTSLKNGTVVSTGGLAPSTAGIRVRIQKGRLKVTDGPFTESKEVIGGYAVIAAATRHEAIRATTEFMQCHQACKARRLSALKVPHPILTEVRDGERCRC